MFYLSMIFLCLFGISVEGIAFQSIEDCEKYVSTQQRKCIIEIISIFHVCMVWIEKSVTRVTDRHHEACEKYVSTQQRKCIIEIISIFHVCMVWIEKSVTRVTDRHHEACRVMPNSDPE